MSLSFTEKRLIKAILFRVVREIRVQKVDDMDLRDTL